MRFETDLDTTKLQSILSDFVAIVGWDAWDKRQQGLQQQLKENPLLRDYFLDRHSLELALFSLVSYRRARGRLPKEVRNRDEYQLYSFMAMIVSFYKRLTPMARNQLTGRLRDGLQSENGLAALQHEMHAAAHFLRNGYDVEPFDLEHGGGVDFIINRDGVIAEVECKMASADIGRMIHRRHMVHLSRVLQPVLAATALSTHGGRILSIVFPGRLTGRTEQHATVAAGVAAALSGDGSASAPEYTIQTTTFDLVTSPFWDVAGPEAPGEILRSYLTQQIGKPSTHAIVYGIRHQSSIIVTIESAQPDAVADGIYRQLKGATKTQFSREWPGVLIAALSNITPSQLRDLAGGPNAIQTIATRLFNRSERAFLHTVAFVSAGDMQRKSEISGTRHFDLVTDDGPSYMFRNANNQYGKNPQYNFFDAAPTTAYVPSGSDIA